MYLCLFEDEHVSNLRPLTDTRSVYDLRIGGRTIGEQTVSATDATHTLLHVRHALEGTRVSAEKPNGRLVNRVPGSLGVLFVNGRAILRAGSAATRQIIAAVDSANPRLFTQDRDTVAAWMPDGSVVDLSQDALTASSFGNVESTKISGVTMISRMWELLDQIPDSLEEEFVDIARGYNVMERPGADIHESALLVNGDRIHAAKGSSIRPGAIIDATSGPVLIDEGATVFERSIIKGPAYIGSGSQVKAGANIRSVAIGSLCKVAGEIHDTIIQSHSNKAHDGFLGNAYIGSWCNLGAATNNSNLKNDYGPVRLHNIAIDAEENTERQFVGLFMGDHSKCSIGTTFNTGTVIGVSCNLFGSGFHARYVPSFCWGSPGGYDAYRVDKALHVADRVMQRRDVSITPHDRELLTAIFEAAATDRARFLANS